MEPPVSASRSPPAASGRTTIAGATAACRRGAPADGAGREIERDDAAGAAVGEFGRRDDHRGARDDRRGRDDVPAERGGPACLQRRRELARGRAGVRGVAAELRPVAGAVQRHRRACLDRRGRHRVASTRAARLEHEPVRARRQGRQRRAIAPPAGERERERRAAVDARGHLCRGGVELGRGDELLAARRARHREVRRVDGRAVVRRQPAAVDRDDAIARGREVEAAHHERLGGELDDAAVIGHAVTVRVAGQDVRDAELAQRVDHGRRRRHVRERDDRHPLVDAGELGAEVQAHVGVGHHQVPHDEVDAVDVEAVVVRPVVRVPRVAAVVPVVVARHRHVRHAEVIERLIDELELAHAVALRDVAEDREERRAVGDGGARGGREVGRAEVGLVEQHVRVGGDDERQRPADRLGERAQGQIDRLVVIHARPHRAGLVTVGHANPHDAVALVVGDVEGELTARVGGREREHVVRDDRVRHAALARARPPIAVGVGEHLTVDDQVEGREPHVALR